MKVLIKLYNLKDNINRNLFYTIYLVDKYNTHLVMLSNN
jgi:hypothetical protein